MWCLPYLDIPDDRNFFRDLHDFLYGLSNFQLQRDQHCNLHVGHLCRGQMALVAQQAVNRYGRNLLTEGSAFTFRAADENVRRQVFLRLGG